MLKQSGRDLRRMPRIGSAWTGRWTPSHLVLVLSVVAVALAGFILSEDNVIGSSVAFAVNVFCVLALIAGDAWLVRRRPHRSHD